MLLTIDKLIYGGNGMARLPADEKGPGKAVFLPFVLQGEQVEAEISEHKPGFARARVEQIIEPSPQRLDPGCPYFGECGGCHYQHTSYEHQLEIKSTILRETLRRIAKLELAQEIHVHTSPPWNYRNRTRMRVRTRPFVLGYSHFRSQDLLPVEQCPISSPLINRAIAAMWELGPDGKVSGDIAEVEFFANAEDTQLLVELTVQQPAWKPGRKSPLPQFVRDVREKVPEIVGIVVFHPGTQGELQQEDIPVELRDIFGAEHLVYSIAGAQYRVSAGSFFQTNRFLIDTLVRLVTEGRSGGYVLDLYAGAGLFSLILSQNFREVGAVEVAPFSFHDL